MEYISTFNPRLIGTYYSMSGFADRTEFDDKIKFLIPFENIIYSIESAKIKPYYILEDPNYMDISKINSQDELFKSFTRR